MAAHGAEYINNRFLICSLMFNVNSVNQLLHIYILHFLSYRNICINIKYLFKKWKLEIVANDK